MSLGWTKPTVFDVLRIDDGCPPLKDYQVWTIECFAEQHAILEHWYDILLDVKRKSEPVEIFMLAHRNIFSRLPIPTSNDCRVMFPNEGVSEGLQLGTLLLLKKIVSLVASEVYTDSFVMPHFIVDLTRVYRFAVEVYRRFNPIVNNLPISWFSLYQYVNSRNSFQVPGEIKITLDQLVESFKIFSPEGYLTPSKDFETIPLFYADWKELSIRYASSYSKIGPSRINSTTVDNVLSFASLADSIGLKPEEAKERYHSKDVVKWENSFGGQIYLTVEQIAQYSTFAMFLEVDSYKSAINDKNYIKWQIQETLGPEDYFLIETPNEQKWADKYSYYSGLSSAFKSVDLNKVSLKSRMVAFSHQQIKNSISNQSTMRIDEFRPEAELIKLIGKKQNVKGLNSLYQSAAGPSALSFDVLLEHYEIRPALLLNVDHRSFFTAVLRSAHVFQTACESEPLILERMKIFFHKLYNEDTKRLEQSNLHIERLLWATSVIRYICTLSTRVQVKFSGLHGVMIRDLYEFGSKTTMEGRIAPHIIASQKYLPSFFQLSILQLARLHLIVGLLPSTDPNDLYLWTEMTHEMQNNAGKIQSALIEGDDDTRTNLWKLILKEPEDIELAIKRKPLKLPLGTLLKVSGLLVRQKREEEFYQRWKDHLKRFSYTTGGWRAKANEKVLKGVTEKLKETLDVIRNETLPLSKTAQEMLVVTDNSFFIQIGNRQITVDWMTGRLTGVNLSTFTETALPVYLRKHPDFALFKSILRRPVVRNSVTGKTSFERIEHLTIDIDAGVAKFIFRNREYRLISRSQIQSLELPQQLNHNFSVWISEEEVSDDIYGIITPHDKLGIPHPIYTIDRSGKIHMIKGNPNLFLASEDYYAEANLFKRWALEQKHILVWLDQNNQVAELHLPYNNGENQITRVIKHPDGRWWLAGLDLYLEGTNEAISAFLGHQVYLVARNSDGQRMLLLPSTTPYELIRRNDSSKKQEELNWDQLLLSEIDQRIHQYRIYPSGEIEGLTVADNLLFMLWKFRFADYPSVADLAKRWLIPSGRPYTREEENILTAWIKRNYIVPMEFELHPSGLSLRLYVIMQIVRHVKNYPNLNEKGKMSDFTKSVIGDRYDSYQTRREIAEKIIQESIFHKQMRGTQLEHLFSTYDQEAILRYQVEEDQKYDNFFVRHLQQRLELGRANYLPDYTLVEATTTTREVKSDTFDVKWSQYAVDEMVRTYPTIVQSDEIPIERLGKTVVGTNASQIFDKAYRLIKSGPLNQIEKEEYQALIEAILNLRNKKLSNMITRSKLVSLGTFGHVEKVDIMFWLVLEQTYLAKRANKKLPELPSLQRRFGVALAGSQELARNFFQDIIIHSGKSLPELYVEYCKEWVAESEVRYLHQNDVYNPSTEKFRSQLAENHSTLLKEEVLKWRTLKAKKSPVLTRTEDANLKWNYTFPVEWKNLPLEDLLPKLDERIQMLTKAKSKRKQTLLFFANALPKGENKKLQEFARMIHYGVPYSVDECISDVFTKDTQYQKTVILYLETAIELNHLKRSKKELDLCLVNPAEISEAKKLLFTPHKYLPSIKNLPLMITEYYADCRLRTDPDQALLIDQLTTETKAKGTVIQAIMGSGKSKTIAPAWLRIMYNRGRIPILCVPSALFRTTISDLQEMMWKRFRTHVKALTFERENCTLDFLYALAEKLHVGKLEPTVYVCSPRDLHALQLMLKERHQLVEDMRNRLKQFTLTWGEKNVPKHAMDRFTEYVNTNSWSSARSLAGPSFEQWYDSSMKLEIELKPLLEEANVLQGILNLLHTEGAILFDEVANSWDPRNLLSFPIGWQVPFNPHAITLGCKLYFNWLVPFYSELGILDNTQTFTTAEQRRAVYNQIARKAWVEYQQYIPNLPALKDFTAYLMSDNILGKQMEAFILSVNSRSSIILRYCAQEIAALKYCLTAGLEGALTSKLHVSYGRSKRDKDQYIAIPYQDSNIPKEGTVFRSPMKTVVLTLQMYAQEWTDPVQTAELISYTSGIEPFSKDRGILDSALKVWGRAFNDADLTNTETMQKMTDELDNARKDPVKAAAAWILISTYLQNCVFPSQLKLDPAQLTSTPQDLPMMAAKSDAMGGTFGFEATWNPNLSRRPDFSSDETILKALSEKRNQECHVIPRGGVESFFAMLETGTFKDKIALIDAGAIFKGIANEVVARRLFKLYATFGYDCILYFDDNREGGARLALISEAGKTVLESSDKEYVRRTLLQMKLTKSLAYYDQARRIGADLELRPGSAIVTFSDSVTLDDLLQACMRCRGLIKGMHSVLFVIPEEMGDTWTGEKVIFIAKKQKQNEEGKANFHAICEQMRGNVRSFIDKTMRKQPQESRRHEFYRQAGPFMMEEQSNDMVKTYGRLHEMVSCKLALTKLRNSLVEFSKKILPEEVEVISQNLTKILDWHVQRGTELPEFVREGEIMEDAVQEVDQSKDMDRLRLMEEEYERMLGSRNPKQEINWEELSLDQIKPSLIVAPAQAHKMPALYYLKDALKDREYPVQCDANILISANLMTTFVGQTNSLLTDDQKTLHRILYAPTQGKPTLVLLSEGDADHLKGILLKKCESGWYLFEPSGVINQRGNLSDTRYVNMWVDGTLEMRSWLVQVLCFQGSAIVLDLLPEDEVRAALDYFVGDDGARMVSLRGLFEFAMERSKDQINHYRGSMKLRGMFVYRGKPPAPKLDKDRETHYEDKTNCKIT